MVTRHPMTIERMRRNPQSRKSHRQWKTKMEASMATTRWLGGMIAGVGFLFGGVAVADASTVQLATGILPVKISNSGRVGRGTGSGVMMASITPMEGNKVLAIWMDSDVPLTQ